MEQDDLKCIAACLNGNMAEFRILVERYHAFAYTLALRVTKNNEDAEEVTQDAFVKVYKSLAGFKGESKFSTWLYKIVLNLSITKLKSRKNLHQPIDDKIMHIEAIDNSMVVKERTFYVEKAITSLPEEEALMVSMHYMDKVPLDDIATFFNLSLSNTKIKLFRARKKMAEVLKNELKDQLFSIL